MPLDSLTAQTACQLPNIHLFSMALHSRSFQFASYLLSPATRERVEKLYALCRALDNLADDAELQTQSGHLLFTIKQTLQDNTAHAWLQALELAPIERAALIRLINTVESDLQPVCMQTESDLLRYAYGVAGSVGLLVLPALGVKAPAAAYSAAALGMAMQLSNIARDVVDDAKLGRIYLPAEWLTQAVPVQALARAEEKALRACVPALVRVCALAEVLYQVAEAGLSNIPFRNRIGVGAALRSYRAIGRKVLRSLPTLGFASRQRVGAAEKLICALQALCASGATSASMVLPNNIDSLIRQLLRSDLEPSDAALSFI
jgi:15-cis-phytoene synthase